MCREKLKLQQAASATQMRREMDRQSNNHFFLPAELMDV